MRYIAILWTVLCLWPLGARAGEITIENPHAYATTAVQRHGAVFMEIENAGAADRVISAESDVAERVELHTHMMDGDMMMMREVEGYDLPAGKSVTLEPMGHHIMLMELHHKLDAGARFPLTLNFEHHAPITVDVMVKKPGEM